MLHIRNQQGRTITSLLSLALLLSLSACGPSGSEETASAATSTPEGSVVQTVATSVPVVSSPVETEGDQEDQDLPDGEVTSPDAEPSPTADSSVPKTASIPYSEEALEKKLTNILTSIITDGMSEREQARAVFDYITKHIRFIGNSDKSDWQKGAYEGLSLGRGDCFTFYAASRALLTALDIDNLEVRRSGGISDHYWNLVNCGDGWYHFDTCPRKFKMEGFDGFMFTDEVAATYSSLREDIPCYYDFDASLYPERAGGSPPAESPEPVPSVSPDDQSVETPVPQPTAPLDSQPTDTDTIPSSSPGLEVAETAPVSESPTPPESFPAESSQPTDGESEEGPFIPTPAGTEPSSQAS